MNAMIFTFKLCLSCYRRDSLDPVPIINSFKRKLDADGNTEKSKAGLKCSLRNLMWTSRTMIAGCCLSIVEDLKICFPDEEYGGDWVVSRYGNQAQKTVMSLFYQLPYAQQV